MRHSQLNFLTFNSHMNKHLFNLLVDFSKCNVIYTDNNCNDYVTNVKCGCNRELLGYICEHIRNLHWGKLNIHGPWGIEINTCDFCNIIYNCHFCKINTIYDSHILRRPLTYNSCEECSLYIRRFLELYSNTRMFNMFIAHARNNLHVLCLTNSSLFHNLMSIDTQRFVIIIMLIKHITSRFYIYDVSWHITRLMCESIL